MVIAVSGKGGTGKTTIAALIVRRLIQKREKPILAVDADPNSNLGEKLGLHAERTIGNLREDTLKHKHQAAGTPKQWTLECEVQEAVAEGSGFDLLVMGRGEGPGCYCSVNNMLRALMGKMSSAYKHIVIDNEAGMEHLSRRTDDKVDLMLMVSDATPTGLRSAKRIGELAKGLEVVRGRMGLIVNRATDVDLAERNAAEYAGLDLIGLIPEDPLIRDYEMRGQPILTLPDDSEAAVALDTALTNAGA